MVDEAKLKVLNTKDELKKYTEKLQHSKEKLEKLKKHKQDGIRKAQFNIINKVDIITQRLSDRACE